MMKIIDVFLKMSHWGGYNEYRQSMFSTEMRKNVYPYKPQLYYIQVGYKRVFSARTCSHYDT